MHWLKTKMVSTFTSKPYSGNPAWVVIGANVEEDERKLVRLASELNPVSDTVFVFREEGDADVSLRFFSKSEEINFSGHGTIATYLGLENDNLVSFIEPITLIRQKTKTGIQHIELRVVNNKVERVTVSLPVPQCINTALDIKQIARFLAIPSFDITGASFPIGVVTLSGFTDIIVPVESYDALQNMNPNYILMMNHCNRFQINGVVVWWMKKEEEGKTIYMRHFAPSIGINEDPVSGAASAALGYFLVERKIIPMSEVTRIIVEQGFCMNRTGRVYVHVHIHENQVMKVTFGGQGIVTFEGRILLPED